MGLNLECNYAEIKMVILQEIVIALEKDGNNIFEKLQSPRRSEVKMMAVDGLRSGTLIIRIK